MNDYSGEKFLDELYKDLYNSEEVNRKKKNTDKKHEAIKRYLDTLEKVHISRYKETLKGFYYEKYIAKNEMALKEKIKKQYVNLPETRVNEAVDIVIKAQKLSLDKWIDYLSNDTAYYPVWAKYWAFQAMLKMGTYDEGTGSYQKRSKDTEEPFVDANPEIIAKAMEIVVQKVKEVYGDKNPSKKDIEKLKQEVNFSKLYAVLEKKYVNNVIEYSGTEGIWIKYNQGNKEDAIKLCNSLQNKNTHWCTAEESMAISQVCGPYSDSQEGGDFYVYYTKDKEGNYTLPRIAIRMNNHDEIGEIRGILEGQNLEEDMEPILEEKLKEMTFLNEEDRNDAFNKLEGLRELTKIYQKTIQKEELTSDELTNLYTKDYGFGWQRDPRVEKTLKKRNILEDFERAKDYSLKYQIIRWIKHEENINIEIKDEDYIKYCIQNNIQIETVFKFFNPKYSKDYSELAKMAVSKDGSLIKYVNPEYVTNYEELANIVVKQNNNTIQYINPEYVTNYEELATFAVKQNNNTIQYINPEYVTNYEELATLVVTKYPYMIDYINPEYVTNYEELATFAVKQNNSIIAFVKSEYVSNYEKLVLEAVTNNPYNIKYIKPEKVSNYEELVNIAVTTDSKVIAHIDSEKVSNYEKLATIAVTTDPKAILYIDPEKVTNYEELATIAVTKDPKVIQYIKPEKVSNYEKLAKKAVSKDGEMILFINPKNVTNYEELATIAVTNDSYAIEYVESEYVTNYEELATIAVTNQGTAIKCINVEEVTNYEELATIAVTNDSYAIEYIESEYVSNYEELAILAFNKDHSVLDFIDFDEVSEKFIMIALNEDGSFLEFVDPENVSNYDKLAKIAVSNNSEAIKFINPEDVTNYEELVKISKQTNDETKDEKYGFGNLGFIDIFSITTLLFALGIMIITIIKIINK